MKKKQTLTKIVVKLTTINTLRLLFYFYNTNNTCTAVKIYFYINLNIWCKGGNSR